ncbi:DUF4214 domain-containing protein [Roseiterribacter gracilis]|uniref:DUF4214 domain-containing protein n=1 Tax=Roseiterribacter gracilis TaxID=2812848 RepID=A0A8S8XE62_9PROT|nr:hypothetical protein TMPK1_24790 [Rhodospirillales bacterium TMPK1]
MFAFNVTLTDPTGRLDSATQALIKGDLEGALRWIGRYVQGQGSLELAAMGVSVGTTGYLADADANAFPSVAPLAGGGSLIAAGPAYELVTGSDPNGATPDFHVSLNVDLIGRYWFDPTPDDLSDGPPVGLIDFENVMVHEVLHALGFTGNQRDLNGNFANLDRSPYDLATRQDANGLWIYDSAAVRAANNGNPVPVDATHGLGSRWYHVDVPTDLLFWAAGSGVRRPLSDIDLAILHDNGIQSVTPDADSNIWFGNDTSDIVAGLAGDDHLFAMGGDDRLTGGTGNDLLDGGDGVDTAVYIATKAQVQITGAAGNRTINSAQDGRDTVRNVEVFVFGDKTYFDLAGSDATVGRLYGAAFARAPDAAGLAVQLNALHQGLTPLQLAANFIASAEFVVRYGASPSDVAYVTALYNNVLGRIPDQGGFNVQVDALAHGTTRAQLLLNFGDSPENQAKVTSDWMLA